MADLSFPEFNIRISEQPNGLMISQHGRDYLARDWTLSRQVYGIIRSTMKAGLTSVWTNNNPQPSRNDAHYICFALSHDDPWAFKLAGEGLPRGDDPAIRCITVNKIHANRLAKKMWFCVKKQKNRTPMKSG